MTYLEWNLEGGEDVDPEAPLGRIALTGESGRIEDASLMLDTFLEAIIDGLAGIERMSAVRIDTVDEPFDLVFRTRPGGLEIGYGDQVTVIGDVDALRRELTTTVARLVATLDGAARRRRGSTPRYPKLRDFLAGRGSR